jgi:hypothetical protein
MRISAVLIDIDGVLTVSWKPLPGAVAALRQLRAAGLPRTSDGLQLDSGAFVAGLEQAAGIEAEVVGKPAAAFFATALAHLGAAAAHTLMVGDDIETDVLAAQRQGLTGVLVKPANTCPAPTTTPAAHPTTSLAPSPICRPAGAPGMTAQPRTCATRPATTARASQFQCRHFSAGIE